MKQFNENWDGVTRKTNLNEVKSKDGLHVNPQGSLVITNGNYKIFWLTTVAAAEVALTSWLMNKIDNPNKKLVQKGQLISTIFESNAEVVVTIGAGDIGEMVSAIKNKLYEKVL